MERSRRPNDGCRARESMYNKETSRTPSGDYRLPGVVESKVKNALLAMLKRAPAPLRRWHVNRHRRYQVAIVNGELGQGDPANKFDAMQLPDDMTGVTVLDIGCAEGYFARACATRGASRVVGIDASLASILCAAFIARHDELSIDFRIGSFPDSSMNESFNLVFCLSVLHHMVSTKDITLLLSDSGYADDLAVLRRLLRYLYDRTEPGGLCVVEMPYEPSTEVSRENADYDLFVNELRRSGFPNAERIGSWDFDSACRGKKERQIYHARR